MKLNTVKKKEIKEFFQTIIMPVIVGLCFLVWVYAIIVSHEWKIIVFPLSVVMLIAFYFLSGPIYAGVLLGFMTTVSFMVIVVAVGSITRLTIFLQTLWLWATFSVLELYKILFQKQKNRILVENEIISADLDIVKNKIEEENNHIVNLKQRLANYNYLEEMTIPLSSIMEEEKIITMVTELSAKFIGKGKWKIEKGANASIFANYIFKYKVPLLIQNISLDNRFSAVSPGFRSFIAVQMDVGGKYWGILRGVSDNENTFDESDLRLLSILGSISSLALTNAQLYRRTQELAITDSLTGLYVQSYFKERLSQEFVRSKRYSFSLAVAMIDLDHFKNINDSHGHIAGDEILQQVSSVIKKRLRDTDLFSRYGGEEFGIIMLQTTSEEAVKVCEDLRKGVENQTFHINSEKNKKLEIKMTVSAGIASIGENVKNYDSLIASADSALYKAKQKGRNRVEVYNYDEEAK